MDRELEARLRRLEADGLLRHLSATTPPAPLISMPGRAEPLINLSSNDYLGLAGHPDVTRAAAEAARALGAGAGASRLITGALAIHADLESALARLMDAPRALLFGSGYLANTGVIPALMDGEQDIIYSDALNHASIVDGCRLARASVRTYPHGDVAALGRALARDRGAGGRRLVVSESVFSMDGDRAPLAGLCAAAREHHAWVMVDEAHAFGLMGPSGAGLAAELGLAEQVHVRVGTLGKAAGAYGAFVAGSEALGRYLVNSARGLIYSTALPPPVAAAAQAAASIIAGEQGDRLRRELSQAAAELRRGLTRQGWRLLPGEGAIVPLMVGDADEAVALAAALLERGVVARPIRYPTVARGSERLRLVLSAGHRGPLVQRALEAFAQVAVSCRP